VTLFVVLCQAAVARLIADADAAGRTRNWLLAGAMAGLALSTQYYAFPIAVPIAVAALIAARSHGWSVALQGLLWAGAAAVLAFAATSPFFLVEWRTVARDVGAVTQIDVERAVSGAGAFSSFGAYLRMIATDAVGWTTCAAAVAGALVAVRVDARRGLLLLCFPLAFLVIVLANTVPMSRYLNPMLPSLALAASFAVSRLVASRFHSAAPAIAVMLLIAVPGFLGSIRADRFYSQADTRTLAREFIERTAPPGSTVLVQPHSVQLHPSREGLLEALRLHLGSERAASIKFQKQLDAATVTTPTYRVLYLGKVTDSGFDPEKIYVSPDEFRRGPDLDPLRRARVEYVAVTRYNNGAPAFEPLYAALAREGRQLAVFSPYHADAGLEPRAAVTPFFHNTADRIDPALERPGPIIEVWQVGAPTARQEATH
jgi:hypothetical protein